ncbi:MAG TPA: DUF6782 family putative metallopeptidase [Acidimicrobiales bacterium]|nr:DUF6782 family putative metallopeptidase [Acidimicrobiales bacterium]
MPPARRLLPVAVAVLLVANVAGLMVHDDDPRTPRVVSGPSTTMTVSPSSTVPGTSTTAKDEPLVPPELAGLIAELEAFVEAKRGLTFLHPVKITLLSDKDFRKRIDDQSKYDQAEVDKTTRVLRALDLIPAGTDLAKAQRELLGGAVVGYYDAKAKALFVRGGKPTPAVRETLVHELTHAAQDQHFGVDRPDLAKKEDESDQAWSGLAEGDAVRIEQLYLASLSKKEQDAAAKEQAKQTGGIKDVPRVLIEALSFPYVVGPRFVQTVVGRAGQARLDAAFAAPPTTSEQLLHPDKFLAGEGALEVPDPPTDNNAKVIDRGVFGEFGFIQQLEDVITDQNALFRAAAGWGGDRYVAWDEGPKTCVRVDVVMDTPQDADDLRRALQKWVDRHQGADLSPAGSSPLRFTSCA